jgi:hypothetical protein
LHRDCRDVQARGGAGSGQGNNWLLLTPNTPIWRLSQSIRRPTAKQRWPAPLAPPPDSLHPRTGTRGTDSHRPPSYRFHSLKGDICESPPNISQEAQICCSPSKTFVSKYGPPHKRCLYIVVQSDGPGPGGAVPSRQEQLLGTGTQSPAQNLSGRRRTRNISLTSPISAHILLLQRTFLHLPTLLLQLGPGP